MFGRQDGGQNTICACLKRAGPRDAESGLRPACDARDRDQRERLRGSLVGRRSQLQRRGCRARQKRGGPGRTGAGGRFGSNHLRFSEGDQGGAARQLLRARWFRTRRHLLHFEECGQGEPAKVFVKLPSVGVRTKGIIAHPPPQEGNRLPTELAHRHWQEISLVSILTEIHCRFQTLSYFREAPEVSSHSALR